MSDLLSNCPIIPVVAIDNADQAVGLCKALQKGGVNAIEVTLRTDQALEAIYKRQICLSYPEQRLRQRLCRLMMLGLRR